MTVPADPKIYHITHIDNLARIAGEGWIWSDARRVREGGECHIVGMSTIKRRRLEEIEVGCHPGTRVGEYAPFYFCPRSIMLYILHRGNHPDVAHTGGQRPIVHLRASLFRSIEWATEHNVRWAFSDRNAGAYLARFYDRSEELGNISWNAVDSTDFRDAFVKEGKQAEFLLHDGFPWTLIEEIGVIDAAMSREVSTRIAECSHRPRISIERHWYY